MRITVKLFASLQAGRFAEGPVEVPDGAAVQEIADRLGIPAGSVGIRVVNGRHAGQDQALRPGDSLSLFPPVGGG
jgi:molybdopterin synthase sulfur carrier subunit